MIQFTRMIAGSGLLWLTASLAVAQTSPTPPAAPATPTAQEEPALKAPARRGPKITAATPECAWVGRRIVGLLVRDDPETAEKFKRFYESFDCPSEHIAPAVRCVVVSESASEGQAKALAERVEACWDKPSVRFLNR